MKTINWSNDQLTNLIKRYGLNSSGKIAIRDHINEWNRFLTNLNDGKTKITYESNYRQYFYINKKGLLA